jgi:hypothetical protein
MVSPQKAEYFKGKDCDCRYRRGRSAQRMEDGMTKTPAAPGKSERVKRDSWDMARKLMSQGRVSLKTATWALKQSGHSREDVKRFIEEAGEENEYNKNRELVPEFQNRELV